MADKLKKERTILRGRCTKKINQLNERITSMGASEIQVETDMLESSMAKLMELDSKIAEYERSVTTNTDEDLNRMEDECDYYQKVIRICVLEVKRSLNGSVNARRLEDGGRNNIQGIACASNRSKIDLPKISLPDFFADPLKDNLTCQRFLETLEHLLQGYHLNQIEMYNLLERQCHGRAKEMIASLHVVNQTYDAAKKILMAAFAEEMPQKFALIKKLTELNMRWGRDDPFIYYAHFTKIIESFKELKIELDTVLLYFIWEGLPTKFQDLLVNMTNKSHPDLQNVTEKFLEACNRYVAQTNMEKRSEITNLAASLSSTKHGENSNSNANSKCILCNDLQHRIARCDKYNDPNQKVDRIKELKLCLKCLKAGHFYKDCAFQVTGKCYKCSKKHWAFLCNVDFNRGGNSKREITEKNGSKTPKLNPANNKNKIKESNKTYDNTKTEGRVTISTNAISTHLDIVDSLLPLLTVFPSEEVGKIVPVDTVLDGGSQQSFIEQDLADQLKLQIIDDKVPLVIRGFNGSRKINTKTVEFPVIIAGCKVKIACICIPEIKIRFQTPGLNKLINLLHRDGHVMAYRKFNGHGSEEVKDIQFLIGARDWVNVMRFEGGVIGTEPKMSAYYKVPEGLILVGSIRDWLINYKFLKEELQSDPVVEVLSNVLLVDNTKPIVISANMVQIVTENDYDVQVKSNSTDIIDVKSVFDIDEVSEDILDYASYAQLDSSCELILNVEKTKPLDEEIAESEKEVTDFILENSYRDAEGYHVMAIPWLARYKNQLNSNENLALKVLKSIEKKYKGRGEVLKRVDEVFKEQMELGIIERIEDVDRFKGDHLKISFLSHFPLIKEDRLTTKIRVIYMANLAEKEADGMKSLSLNQCIHPGYCKNFKIADALRFIRFDSFLLGFDISKAFHCMKISDENSSKFLFYWFQNVNEKDFTPVIFRFTRVIFGMSVAPFLLTCALYSFLNNKQQEESKLKAVDYERIKDLKSRIYQGSYADNIFAGCDSMEELEFTYYNAVELFERNKFPLQQFVTNHLDFQNRLDLEHGIDTPNQVKVLGMQWIRDEDSLKAPDFKMDLEATTKRQLLKNINSNYDLMNSNLPVLNRAKLLLRDLQINEKLGWDDFIGSTNISNWRVIAKQFNSYENIEVSRYFGHRDSEYDLIALSDASKDFLGCVIYIKELSTGKVSFVEAHNKMLDKSLKSRTMPVLEFVAVEFTVKKILEIYNTFCRAPVPVKVKDCLVFSDSSIALSWIRKSELLLNKSQKRSVFINNRINNVVDLCKTVHSVKFAHIGTEENTADLTTRIVSPKALKRSSYILGPHWLQENLKDIDWIQVPNPDVNNDTCLPKFSMNKVVVELVKSELNEILDLNKYSSLNVVVRTLQSIKMFVRKLKMKLFIKDPVKYSHFGEVNDKVSVDYTKCKTELLQLDQRKEFPEVFGFFESKNKTKSNIPYLVEKLNIVLDPSDQLLKVKSKMSKMREGKIARTPVLLSKSSQFMKLLVNDVHRKLNHSGIYYLLHQLKRQYFILKAYSAVKRILKKCYHCKRFHSRTIKTNQNDYKSWMVSPKQRFFGQCFVDYFGPLTSYLGTEKVKTYGVLFKCIWSKMINVELVMSADSKSFLMAFQNHIYQYGMPGLLYSDAGSNLSSAFGWIRDSLDSSDVKDFLSRAGIEQCILDQYPKGSLNRGIGGIVENSVGLIKKLIQGAIRNKVLDFQQLDHIVKQCVCYANKRPITNLAALREQDPEAEFMVISPELLKFGYETAVMELNFPVQEDELWSEDELTNGIDFSDWQGMLKAKERLREYYHSEFLYGLMDLATQNKNKYTPVAHQRLQKGDIVLIKDPMVKAPNYPLAKVLEVITNSRDETTQATLYKANKSIIKRDISSLILFVRNEQSGQYSSDEGKVDNIMGSNANPNERPKRQAAVKCIQKIKAMVAENKV